MYTVWYRMLRQPLTRALALKSPTRAAPLAARCQATQIQPQPEKVEVFIDDKPVYVLPGTTILQASCLKMLLTIILYLNKNSWLVYAVANLICYLDIIKDKNVWFKNNVLVNLLTGSSSSWCWNPTILLSWTPGCCW